MHRNHAHTEYKSLAQRSQRTHLLPQLFLVRADKCCFQHADSFLHAKKRFLSQGTTLATSSPSPESVCSPLRQKWSTKILVTSAGDVISRPRHGRIFTTSH